jgi:hypothetical protein
MKVARCFPGARVVAVALFVLSLPARAGAEMCVDVDLRFPDGPPNNVLVQSIIDEASSIWAPYGMRIRWVSAVNVDHCVSSQGSFDVQISRRPLQSVGTSASTLGVTHLTLNGIHHVPIHVDQQATDNLLRMMTFDQVVRVLGRANVGPADLGRALGRVLAHELGHVVLAEHGHQPRGLMRPMFVVEDLIRPQRDAYILTPSETARLHARELELTRQ